MKFNYLVRNTKGETQSGNIEAPNESVALKNLQSRNLIVIRLKAAEDAALLGRRLKIFERVKRREIFVFFRELSVLAGANIPLVQSLKALSQQIENPYFKEIISAVANDVEGGTSFSKALSKYPKIFSAFSINLIKSGEIAGLLQECLDYLADYLEKEYYLIAKIRSAMAYPAFILGAFLIIGVVVMVMVIPQLTAILVEAGQELPLSTRIVIATSEFIRGWGWLLLAILIVAIFAAWRYNKTEKGKMFIDGIKLKLPVFGKILQKTYLARLADNLSALVKGGVSIIEALNISGQVVGNAVIRNIMWQARDGVKMGRSISSTLEKHKEFPPLFYQMIKTGEKTGQLDIILSKLSSFYNKEVDNVVNSLSSLIEPVLIILLGIGVSILVFAVFIPIYNLAGAF